MRLLVDPAGVEGAIERVAVRDSRAGEDARAAVEWLTAGDGEEQPAEFSLRQLQVFLWYELPRKWLIETDEQIGVADALGSFFDELGAQAVELSALCRAPETRQLLRDGGDGFVEAIEASGVEPPDTLLLEWSDLMTIEESLERDAVVEMLESAVDDGRLSPGTKGWRERQVELVERHLLTPDESGKTPLARIHAARREAWLERVPGEDRSLLARATPPAEWTPSAEEAALAVEPLLWLLGRLADGVKLTQTGALPRALVREAVERYPDWWDSELLGAPPHRAADVYPVEVLHTLVEELKLARPRKGVLKLGPRGRHLRSDPAALLRTVASTIASAGVSAQLDLALADLLSAGDGGESVDFRLLHLLGPFYGIVGGRFRRESDVTAGGRTLAAAILRELAYGPRHSFA